MIDIRNERNKLSISQAQLAKLTGISQTILSAYECGKKLPSNEDIQLIKFVLSEINNGTIIPNRKKQICRTKFDNSVINERPRKSYERTVKNTNYLSALNELAIQFNVKRENAPIAVSCFAGCGGLCYGIKAAGFNIVATNELMEDYKQIYKANFPDINFLPNDIKDITNDDIEALKKNYPQIDLLAGGPPCQGFSLAGKRDVDDNRNTLFTYYLKLASKLRPKVILMENVKLLTSMKNPEGKLVKDEIINTFTKIGYNGDFYCVNASSYGVPQNRERVFFIGIRKDLGLSPSFPKPTHFMGSNWLGQSCLTFGDAVSDLEFIESGEVSANDSLHKATNHPEHVLRWLVDVPQGKSAHENKNPEMRPPSGYNTTYKRQKWDEPGCTVTTNFNMISGCNNVHPIATRSLTIREAMRLQSFPDSFKFTGKEGTIRTVIGNAVPPLLAFSVAKFILENYILSNS